MIINPYRFSAAGVTFDGFGNASRSFDGINDTVQMGDVLDSVFAGAGKQFTITAWIKNIALNNEVAVSKWGSTDRSFFLRVLSNGSFGVSLSSDGTTANRWGRVTDASLISANTWHHLALTYDQTATGDYVRMWVDGVEDATLTAYLVDGTFSSINDSIASFDISGTGNGFSNLFDGNIADVRVYDTDIPDSAIEGLAIGTDYQTNLVGWWLDDDNDVLDNAGANDGTNSGSTYSTDGPAD